MNPIETLPPLQIGDLQINPPIIQGGMGVRVSSSNLASAVSNEGALGVIATVGAGKENLDTNQASYVAHSEAGLRQMIRDTRALTSKPIGVNIMCALTNYDSLVRASVEEGVEVIISGGGLPLKLPSLVPDSEIKLIPVVSTGRAAALLCKTWARKYKRLPDAIVVEGPLAGGHLGFEMEDIQNESAANLEFALAEVLEVVESYKSPDEKPIPVIAAGGIFDGGDIAHFLSLGASGVQIATRFVCTDECDAHQAYKDAYVNSTKEDIMVMKSPLGLPLRVIRNAFIDKIMHGERMPFKCQYRCLAPCNPAETRYCIAKALLNAVQGNMEEGFTTCGANAYRIDKIVSVHDLIQELSEQTVEGLLNKKAAVAALPASDFA